MSVVLFILIPVLAVTGVWVFWAKFKEDSEYLEAYRQREHWHFKPKDDISPFELARCTSIILDAQSIPNGEFKFRLKSEGEAVSRHWECA